MLGQTPPLHIYVSFAIAWMSLFVASSNAVAFDCLPVEQQKIHSFQGGADDASGYSVAIDGNFAVVGEIRDNVIFNNDAIVDAGSASVYEFIQGTWQFRQRLLAPDFQAHAWFGFSVDIEGDVIVVGAPYHDTIAGFDVGAAYVYRRSGNTFAYEETLVAPDGHTDASFGISVATTRRFNNDRIAVGAFFDNEEADEAGAVYLYERNITEVWQFGTKLTANDAEAHDQFGRVLSMNERYLVIGAPGNDDVGSSSGSAYIFDQIGLSPFQTIQRAKLTADDADDGDLFGAAVSIDTDGTVIVGAYASNQPANNMGAAYIYRPVGNAWPQEMKLTASDGIINDNFGYSVAIKGNTAVVGARLDDDMAPSSGSVYTFRRTGGTWDEAAKLVPSDGQNNDQFGSAIAIDASTIIAGAPGSNDFAVDAGSAYFFPVACPALIGDMNCDDVVDLLDVAPFVLALINPDDYNLQHPTCDPLNGDANEDSQLNSLDTAGFIDALLGN